jgi:fluoride ion exporter CrcB/FEX
VKQVLPHRQSGFASGTQSAGKLFQIQVTILLQGGTALWLIVMKFIKPAVLYGLLGGLTVFSKASRAVLKLCATGRLMEVVWLLATYPDGRSRSHET